MVPLLSDVPRAVGVYAQSFGAAVLTRLGYQLAVPMDATLPFDLLASRDLRSWLTIQIKQASRDGAVGLRRGDKRAGCKSYVAGDFDALLVVDLVTGSYLIPYAAIQRYRSRVCVRDSRFAEFRVCGPMAEAQRGEAGQATVTISSTPQLSLFTKAA